MKNKEFTIKITGSGTKQQIVDALLNLQNELLNDIYHNTNNGKPTITLEDQTLCTTISELTE